MTFVRMLLLAALLAAGSAVGFAAASGSAVGVMAPPGDTIVEITGDAANGFEIHHYDGTSLYPPTDSEARAECDEYAGRVARVRCRTEVRTWYRDLADTQQALDWAHQAGRA
jgi:hypothetical protein